MPALFVIFQSLQEKFTPLKFDEEEDADLAGELEQYASGRPVDYKLEE